MKPNNHYQKRRSLAGLAAGLVLGGLMLGASARADIYEVAYQTNALVAGGVPAQAAITSITPQGTNTTICWYGMAGWYSVQATTNVSTGPWITVGTTEATANSWCLTVANPDPTNSYFFQLNQNNGYAGQGECAGCHGDKFTSWKGTVHSTAFNAINSIGMGANSSCLPCHTVGFNQPTGFTSASATPQLENVGCEDCHGPAAWHKDSDHTLIHPVVSIDPQICGGCHSGHNPQYNEWTNSPHAGVEPAVAGTAAISTSLIYNYLVTPTNGPAFTTNLASSLKFYLTNGAVVVTNTIGTNTVQAISSGILAYSNTTTVSNGIVTIIDTTNDFGGYDRQMSCGPCHSAATRSAMIDDYEARLAGTTNVLTLPSNHDSAMWGPTCANCHDPHSVQQFTSDVIVWTTNQITTNIVIVPGVSTNTVKSTNAITTAVTNTIVTQLRNPMRSTNYFSFFTGSDKRAVTTTNFLGVITTNTVYYNTVFASQYNPNINVCGQCHNTRGARWDGLGYSLTTNLTSSTVTNTVAVNIVTNIITTNVYGGVTYYLTNSQVIGRTNTVVVSTVTNAVVGFGLNSTPSFSRVPHMSPQYNILIGILQPDYLTTNALGVATNYIGRHGIGFSSKSGIFNSNQCVTCHVPSYTSNGTNNTGHTFAMQTNNCIICHSSGAPDWVGFQIGISTTNSYSISNIVVMLNSWATNKGPALFTTNYSKYNIDAWEYTSPGGLGVTNYAGPSTADQLKIPVGIQQARFNVYMLYNDGSFGVHNPNYAKFLLLDASNKVWQASQ